MKSLMFDIGLKITFQHTVCLSNSMLKKCYEEHMHVHHKYLFTFLGQVDEVLLSGLFQFMKTVDKVLIWLLFTDDTGFAMVIAIVSDLGHKRLLLDLL